MKAQALVCLMAGVGLVGSLGAKEFPTAGGDISQPSAWGGGIPSEAEFSKGGTYTASGNVDFQTLHITGGANVFQPSSGVTIGVLSNAYNASGSLAESQRVAFYLTAGASEKTQTFTGGLWNFNSGHLGIPKYGATTDVPLGARVVFQGGAVVTNVGAICIAGPYENPLGSVMTFTGAGTMLHINAQKLDQSAVIIGDPRYSEEVNGRLEILNGAALDINTAIYFDRYANGSAPRNSSLQLLVSGEGSKATFNAALYMGWSWNTGNRIIVDDHASLVSLNNTVNIGYGGNKEPAISNIVVVKNGAMFTAASAGVSLGQTSAQSFIGHSYGNQVHVLSGATWNSSGLYANMGTARRDQYKYAEYCDLGDGTHDNGILVSNATMNIANGIYLNYSAYTYNGWLKVLDGSSVTCAGLRLGLGRTNGYARAEISGSKLKTEEIFVGEGTAARGNLLTISNSTVTTGWKWSLAYSPGAYSNRIEVIDSVVDETAGANTHHLYIGHYSAHNAYDNGLYARNSTFKCKTMAMLVPYTSPTNLQRSYLDFDNVTIDPIDSPIFALGCATNAVGCWATFRSCTLPTLSKINLGGRDSRLAIYDTPVTVADTVNGLGSIPRGTDGAQVLVSGKTSVFTMPTISSWWTWGEYTGSGTSLRAVNDSSLVFTNGASLKFATDVVDVQVGHQNNCGNRLEMYDSSLTCRTVRLRGGNSAFVASGEKGSFNLTMKGKTYSCFLGATNCVYRLTDGICLAPTSYNMYICFEDTISQFNTFSVENKAVLDMAGCIDGSGNPSSDFLLGYWNSGSGKQVDKIHDNTLLVKDGGVITNAGVIHVCYTYNNKFIVDNGQVYCRDVSMKGSSSGPGKDNQVIIRGAAPLLSCSDWFDLGSGFASTLRFEVPANGFSAAPVQVKGRLTVPSDAKLEIDLTDLLAGLEEDRKKLEINLIKTGALTVDDAVFEAAVTSVSEQLGAVNFGGQLYIDGTSIKLRVAPRSASAIVIR